MATTLSVGKPTVIESYSDESSFGAVFEDDGDTGYFYGLDVSQAENPVLDALHIYNVANVGDRERSNEVTIVWTNDGQRVALLINGFAHAAFDFGRRRGYCRSGFPHSSPWSVEGHAWDDASIDFLPSAT